jgi:hypothetical protein
MSRKTSTARREAFFRALGETGNRTIAAERAKVSQSWVTLHRAEEPEFRARMEAAIAQAKARLRGARGVAPASGWGSLAGEELVVRGGNGRRTQIARARLRQWTPRAEQRFLATLAATCNVKAACAAVGLTPASAYGHAGRWTGFAARWAEAVETGYLRIEAALLERGLGDAGPVDAGHPIPPMTVAQAIHLLHMHKHEVRGVGKRPGLQCGPPDLDAVRASILRKIDAIEAARAAKAALGPAVVARDRRDWARQRRETLG